MASALEFDVAIIGGGPAGCALALRLASQGCSAVIVERVDRKSPPIGETLAPEVRVPLRELGLWPAFLAQGPVPSYQLHSAWGSAALQTRDYCCEPYGPAWHVDRAAFDLLLLDAARQHGVALHRCRRLGRLERTKDAWSIDCSDPGIHLRARFITDASGRRAAVARRLGARRQPHDRQVALVAFASGGAAPLTDNSTLIEAAPEGWWYSAVLPDRRVVVAHMTDHDLLPPGAASRCAAFRSRLAATRATRGFRMPEQLGEGLYIVAANTSRLEGAVGDLWLAVGDAMTAHDPLCGAGILYALTGGIGVADTIARALRGDTSAIAGHLAADRETFSRYLRHRASHYAMEQRWPRSLYWERRLAM
jgi:flavin-dependent dehydrogenase